MVTSGLHMEGLRQKSKDGIRPSGFLLVYPFVVLPEVAHVVPCTIGIRPLVIPRPLCDGE